MDRRFDRRFVYLSLALMIVWLLSLGLRIAHDEMVPAPAISDLSQHDAHLHFEAERSTVLFATDCIKVSWQVDNIQTIEINGRARVGQGTMLVCGESPRFDISFRDGSQATYALPRDLTVNLADLLITMLTIGLATYTLCARYLVDSDQVAEQPATRKEIRPLTAFRGVAALVVFFYHWPLFASGTLPHMLEKKGLVGVSLFFVLSGFLIADRYLDNVSTKTFLWRPYLVRRAARILPLYYAILLLVFLWHEPINLGNLTLTQALIPGLWSTGIPTAWSLTVEESFYLLAPLILWLCWRTKRPLLSLCGVLVFAYGLGGLLAGLSIWPTAYMLTRTIAGYMVNFVVGVGCAYVYRQWRPGKRAWLLTLICAVGFFFWAFILKDLSEYPTLMVGTWVAAVLSGGLIVSLTSENGLLVRVGSWGPLVYAGRISYGLYLFQLTPMASDLHSALQSMLGDNSALVDLALYGVVTIICIVLYELIEKPAHRWIVRRLDTIESPKAVSIRPTP